jgi:hypothetical protein
MANPITTGHGQTLTLSPTTPSEAGTRWATLPVHEEPDGLPVTANAAGDVANQHEVSVDTQRHTGRRRLGHPLDQPRDSGEISTGPGAMTFALTIVTPFASKSAASGSAAGTAPREPSPRPSETTPTLWVQVWLGLK